MPTFPSDPRIAKAFQGKPLRPLWHAVKEHQLMMLRTRDTSDGGNMKGVFNKGLGPLLDDFDKECSKYPQHNSRQVQQLLNQIVETIGAYKADIRAAHAGTGGLALTATLEEIEKELDRRAKFYNVTLPRPS